MRNFHFLEFVLKISFRAFQEIKNSYGQFFMFLIFFKYFSLILNFLIFLKIQAKSINPKGMLVAFSLIIFFPTHQKDSILKIFFVSNSTETSTTMENLFTIVDPALKLSIIHFTTRPEKEKENRKIFFRFH